MNREDTLERIQLQILWDRLLAVVEEQAQTLVREEMRRLVEPLERQLNIARDWIRSGELALTDPAELNRRFIPTLAHLEQVSGLAIAGDDGADAQGIEHPSGRIVDGRRKGRLYTAVEQQHLPIRVAQNRRRSG